MRFLYNCLAIKLDSYGLWRTNFSFYCHLICSDIKLLERGGGGGGGPVGGKITSYSGGTESRPSNIALNSFVKINY